MNESFFKALYDKDNYHVFTTQHAIEVFNRTMKDHECQQYNKKKDNEGDLKDLLEVKPLSSVN